MAIVSAFTDTAGLWEMRGSREGVGKRRGGWKLCKRSPPLLAQGQTLVGQHLSPDP